ncbi:hypothetical protein GCM10010260_73480 [Streptomyces filipinensis]|uniref:Uncharacterized protein n=1 Tax=Streptomyces filipinensis TaxID=66887 RepID=A0A918IIE6_9ACTN|nr:hypothetical protein GCM10010260_73480 [Streptomyces filipinensis]
MTSHHWDRGMRDITRRVPLQQKRDQSASREKRGSSGGRPPRFDTAGHRERHAVELAHAVGGTTRHRERRMIRPERELRPG